MKGLNKQICLFTAEIEGLNLVHDWISLKFWHAVTFLSYYLPIYSELEINKNRK